MKKCRVCGKKFDVIYPELWRYKDAKDTRVAKKWYCSWKCLREDEKREEQKRREQKMARPRKITQPAEEKEPDILLVYDESIKEEYRKEQEEKKKEEEAAGGPKDGKLEIAAVFSRALPNHTYKKTQDGMALVGIDMTLVLSDYDWARFAGEIMQAKRQLAGE